MYSPHCPMKVTRLPEEVEIDLLFLYSTTYMYIVLFWVQQKVILKYRRPLGLNVTVRRTQRIPNVLVV